MVAIVVEIEGRIGAVWIEHAHPNHMGSIIARSTDTICNTRDYAAPRFWGRRPGHNALAEPMRSTFCRSGGDGFTPTLTNYVIGKEARQGDVVVK